MMRYCNNGCLCTYMLGRVRLMSNIARCLQHVYVCNTCLCHYVLNIRVWIYVLHTLGMVSTIFCFVVVLDRCCVVVVTVVHFWGLKLWTKASIFRRKSVGYFADLFLYMKMKNDVPDLTTHTLCPDLATHSVSTYRHSTFYSWQLVAGNSAIIWGRDETRVVVF